MLAVEAIRAGYGQLEILQGVSLRVEPRQIAGLIGPNGAGKSTLLKTIFGYLRPTAGAVRFEGRELTGLRPDQVARRGIGFVAQAGGLFADMTVEENLRLGGYPLAAAAARAGVERVYAEFPLLAERRRQPAGSLSGGEQRILALARALVTRPRLLLLDEPSAALAPRFIDRVYEAIVGLNRGGLALLIVEQNVEAILAVADRIFVLDLGRNAFDGPAVVLRASDRIRRLYLGEDPLTGPGTDAAGAARARCSTRTRPMASSVARTTAGTHRDSTCGRTRTMVLPLGASLTATPAAGTGHPLRRRSARGPGRVLPANALDVLPLAGVGLLHGEPGVQNFFGHRLGGGTQAETEHVGVVPEAGPARGLGVRAQGGTHARHLVGHDGDAGAGPAAEHALLRLTRGHLLGHLAGHLGPLGGFTRRWAVHADLVPAPSQLLDENVRQVGALVGTEGYAHNPPSSRETLACSKSIVCPYAANGRPARSVGVRCTARRRAHHQMISSASSSCGNRAWAASQMAVP